MNACAHQPDIEFAFAVGVADVGRLLNPDLLLVLAQQPGASRRACTLPLSHRHAPARGCQGRPFFTRRSSELG